MKGNWIDEWLLVEKSAIFDHFCGELVDIVAHVLNERIGKSYFVESEFADKHFVFVFIEKFGHSGLILLNDISQSFIFNLDDEFGEFLDLIGKGVSLFGALRV